MTDDLRRLGRGRATVLFVVDQAGFVRDARIQDSTHPDFEKPALEAVENWRFTPGHRKGKPVRFRMRLPITFPGEEDPESPEGGGSPPPPRADPDTPLDLGTLEEALRIAETNDSTRPAARTGPKPPVTPPGSIRGTVLDADFDAPLPACQVTLLETGEQVTTTAKGLYAFSRVIPGEHTLIFTCEGYSRQVTPKVVVGSGKVTESDASLTAEYSELEEVIVGDQR